VLSVLDLGLEVDGPAFDEAGTLIRKGDVLAVIDDTRYRLQVETLQARLVAANENLASINVELDRARKTLDRQQHLLDKGMGNQQAVDDATSVYGSLLAKKRRQQALMKESSEQLNQAREDLADTVMYAPFTGRVTGIHVTRGAVVEAGTSIVTLTLMDPIQIQVAVSADYDRKIWTGARAFLYPKNPVDLNGKALEVPALVFEKGSVADPDTHTFRIDLMARNQRLEIHDFIPETLDLPLVNDFLPAARRYQGEESVLFVPADSIYRDQGKDYVLRLPGVGFRSDAQRNAFGRHVPEKIAVAVGDDYFTVVKWTFRNLQHDGEIQEGDVLVLNPRKEYESGLAIGRSQWLFRPGDLVPVRFLLDVTPRGFYVPVDSITVIDGKHSVFVVDDGFARARNVTVHESYQELRRIQGTNIVPGTKVITSGVHYVSDGEPVDIVEQGQEFP
jgi:RND family efflux transporter MFP subunit